ncbi:MULTISPECIES: ATP-binding protein [unclassified Lentimicrobium]|uniref:sensor histidine kinase n=1 Tax=unclassified Lentimicrobium TaxID=2677434 RepID=UPI001557F022|nr:MULTISPECIES: ATP-binding protein [unclassified Lentimicrobium]NPD45572.1 PAS domain-containing protein [Lentimicrobium sp. S6]NPD83651.1 PAS domain-containing protein [Lentimicrobium sp. L6]
MNYIWLVGENNELLEQLQVLFSQGQYQLSEDRELIDIIIYDIRRNINSQDDLLLLQYAQPKVFIYKDEQEIPQYILSLNSSKSFLKFPFDSIEILTQVDLLINNKSDFTFNNNEGIIEQDSFFEVLNRDLYLNTFLNTADNVAFVFTDIGGENTKIKGFSRGAEKIFQYKAEDIIGQDVAVLHEQSDVDGFEEMQLRLRNGLKGYTGTSRLKRKSGEYFDALFTIHPLVNEIGELKGTIGVSIDISELTKVQEQLQEQERVHKTLIKNLPGFIYYCDNDRDWTMRYISEGCIDLTEYQPSDFINNKVVTFNQIIHEDWRKFVWDEWQLAINEKRNIIKDYQIVTKSNQVKWVRERGCGIYDKEGKLDHLEGFITDISDIKRTELIQKVIFNISTAVSISDNLGKSIFHVKNELGKIIDTTNFYVAFYNAKDDTFDLPFFADEKDSLTDLPAGKTMTKYVVDTQKSLLANIATKKQLVKQGKLEIKGSLSKLWLGVPLSVEGVITGVIAVQSYEDENAFNKSDVKMLEFVADQISTTLYRKHAEEELKVALIKAEESDKLKSAFLANMSHEIRTPMNGILGFAALLRHEEISEEERDKFLGIIEKSGNRMLSIINDVIDVSKVDAGIVELYISKVDIVGVCTYLHSFFLPEVEKKGMELVLNLEDINEAYFIETDREKLYAIITNLIKNSIKYSQQGTIEFGCIIKHKEVEFFVKDTGIGIPEEKKKDVFRRFAQLHTTIDEFNEGSGLGLSITKAYVELMEGNIWFNSEQGKGSEFRFILPQNLGHQD